jgi:hypothetical protein
MSRILTPPYKSYSQVKPGSVSNTGVVTFTDGTNEFPPNQKQCEEYGYTYDVNSGTCRAFNYSTTLNEAFINESNTVKGQGNSTLPGTTNTYVLGENNVVNGLSRNNIVIGSGNQIQESVNNAFVYGNLGNATADNSIILGGNAPGDVLGERQVTTVMYGHQTTDASTNISFLNNVTDSFYAIPENAAMYFQADILAVRVAGSSGSGAVGDFKSWVERGVVINKSGTASISRSRTSPASSGTTTGWSPVSTVVGTNYQLTVTGAANMTIEWVASIRFTQIQTSVSL